MRARARRKDHVPITPIVRPAQPWVMCHVDVIGPTEPPSAQGHKWALCIIDDCTRWPAVYLLMSLTAKATCQAFMELFSLVGWLEVLCSDQGTITRVRSPYSYEVQMSDGSCRWLHANKLRPFVARMQNVGVIKDQDVDFGEVVSAPLPAPSTELLPSERIDKNTFSHLNAEQQNALLSVLNQFADIFSYTPGLCIVVQHEINVTVDFKPRTTRAIVHIGCLRP